MSGLLSKILTTLNSPDYRPVDPRELGQQLNVTKKHRHEFLQILQELIESGQVKQGSDGRLRVRPAAGLIQGVVRKIGSGAGFVIPHRTVGSGPEKQPDVYVAPEDLRDAHTGDEVLVQLSRRSQRDDRLRGRIVEIVNRATRVFVGTYFEREGEGWVQADGSTINDPIFVGDPGAKGAQPNDKVVIEMLRFPSHGRGGEGVVTEVLGARGAPGVDTLSIIHEFALPDEFPPEILEFARVQAEKFNEDDLQGRRDLTGETIVTIDPVDARDFDDAISLEVNERGHWLLGVHIADVAHFVPVDSPLDKEAYRRGTSVYLPDRVLPMLPEIISNGLASLQQGRVRYTKSAFMEFTRDGVPVHSEFCNSAIKVTRRFAYEEVMPILQDPEAHRQKVTPKVRQLLQRMYELAMLLRARRFGKGSLELTLPEVKIDFDENHKVTGAHLAPHDASHEIIEEFMLAANIAVATAFDDKAIPFLRRVHPEPDVNKLKALADFVTALGFPIKRWQSRTDLQTLLDSVKGTPQAHAVNYAFLRSLKQAQYSPETIGHYALAAENYCHFTSPIRRYPDLTVHRLLGELVQKGEIKQHEGMVELTTQGEWCSMTERRAEQAERELVKVKLLTYLVNRIGDEFEAIITGVQDYGFFCQAVEVPAEGLVHASTLDDDFYKFDSKAQTLSGHRHGHEYRLGDRVRVVVARVDVDRRQLDFRLAGSVSARRVGLPEDRPTKPLAPSGGRLGAAPPRSGAPRTRSKNGPRRPNRPHNSKRKRRKK